MTAALIRHPEDRDESDKPVGQAFAREARFDCNRLSTMTSASGGGGDGQGDMSIDP
jgi:hypothetical protein